MLPLVSLMIAPPTAQTALQAFLDLNAHEKLATPEGRELREGELGGSTLKTLGTLPRRIDRLVLYRPDRAVGRLLFKGNDGHTTDLYLFLEKRGRWRVTAFRTLATTGILVTLRDELRKRPRLTPKEKATLANVELTLSSDAQLAAWFKMHKAELTKLVVQKKPVDARFSYLRREPNGNVDLVIGGVTDNTVGFRYRPKDDAPPISPGGNIWVERLAPRWFLVRTT